MDIQNVIYQANIMLLDPIPLNVYLVKGNRYAVWIDSGIKSMFPLFQETMARAAVEKGDLRFILHTHSHHDHIGSNAQIQDYTGCLIGAPSYYARWHADFEAHYQEFARSFPDLIPDTPERRAEALDPLDAPRPLDFHLDEGAFFDLGGGVTLRAFSLPGHMMAELGWFESATQTLILGDAITGLDWPLFHGHVTVSGYRSTLDKIRRLIRELGAVRVICAHFPQMTPDEADRLVDKAHAYIDSIEVALIRMLVEQETATLETLWTGLTSRAGKLKEFRSLAMVDAHMQDLKARGVVREVSPHCYALK